MLHVQPEEAVEWITTMDLCWQVHQVLHIIDIEDYTMSKGMRASRVTVYSNTEHHNDSNECMEVISIMINMRVHCMRQPRSLEDRFPLPLLFVVMVNNQPNQWERCVMLPDRMAYCIGTSRITTVGGLRCLSISHEHAAWLSLRSCMHIRRRQNKSTDIQSILAV
jgi:hypothetical protein